MEMFDITTRKIGLHGPYSLMVVLPIEYCRALKLKPGVKVRVIYGPNTFLLVVPPDCEKKLEEKWEEVRRLME